MRIAAVLLALTLPLSLPAKAELRGHGGPVRALAVAPDGVTAVSGGFDAVVIRWSLERGAALAVLRQHDGPVNAAVALADGRFATAGEDGRVLVWAAGADTPERVLAGHTAPVVALAASADGHRIASASWDGTARVWPREGGAPVVLTGHAGNVNGVAFLQDGRVATAGYDATLRFWSAEGAPLRAITLPSPANALVALAGGRLATAHADGRVRLFDDSGRALAEAEVAPTPVIALAAARDGTRLAAAGLRGAIAVLSGETLRLERSLVGPGLPVWSLAFLPNGRELLSGGADRIVRRWDPTSGAHLGPVIMGRPADPLAAYADDPGARVFRACVACHTLGPEDAPRAGPSLHRLFGRRIASLPGYPYSPALKGLDIVWTPETVSRLFELGPSVVTPGTKMPEQVIGNAEDRAALVDFLGRATR